MKKLLIIVLLAAYSTYAQTDEKETLRQLNQKVITLYKSQKYDEALKFAQQAVDLNVKIYGLERRETAVAYTNLGIIYRERGKFKNSVENLQKATNIYQKISGAKSTEDINAYQELGFSQFLDGKKTEAEASYFKSVEISETKFGKQSKESFSPTLNLASFYARGKNFDKADEFYLKAYALAIKNFAKESKEFEQIDDSRICLRGAQKLSDEKEKIFEEAKTKIFKEAHAEKSETTGKSEVINGKAVSLPQPAYPDEAKQQRLSGTASIKVKIDEQGNVIEAKSICRTDVLGKAAEEAALKAKFSPTIFNGKPVKVTGFITYNFIL
jgi:TonB family protein